MKRIPLAPKDKELRRKLKDEKHKQNAVRERMENSKKRRSDYGKHHNYPKRKLP